jgi:hypothetical protein
MRSRTKSIEVSGCDRRPQDVYFVSPPWQTLMSKAHDGRSGAVHHGVAARLLEGKASRRAVFATILCRS